MKLKNITSNSGVYYIKNKTEPDKVYIGCSKNIRGRIQKHIYNLQYTVTGVREFYEDIRILGWDNFEIGVIELTEDYYNREKYYIELYKPYYNYIYSRYNNVMDDPEAKEKHSQTLKTQEYRDKIKATRGFTQEQWFRDLKSRQAKERWEDPAYYEQLCIRNALSQSSQTYKDKRRKMALDYVEQNKLHPPHRKDVYMYDKNMVLIKHFITIGDCIRYLRNDLQHKAGANGLSASIKNNKPYKGYNFKFFKV